MRTSTTTTLRFVALLTVGALALVACGDTEPPGGGAEEAGPVERPGAEGIELTDDSLQAVTVLDDLDQPTSMAFLGDEGLLVTEKATGRVLLLAEDSDEPKVVLDLPVNWFDERGLLGVTVHPEFPDEPLVYVHWTAQTDDDAPNTLSSPDSDVATQVPVLGNRIDRFRWDGGANVLVFDQNIVRFPSNTLDTDTSGKVRGNHDAGPLTFGPDGMLYVMMGDQNLRGQLQNLPGGPPADDAHLAGVILRLEPDGGVPADNPFADAAASIGGEVGENLAMVWAYGIRNSYGLAFEPSSGSLWQTENGDDSYDEVNVFTAGANSGWMQIQGPPERFSNYKDLEVASPDGLDNPTVPPTQLAADATAAEAAMLVLPGSHYSPPVFSWVYPPAVTAVGFVADERLGGASANTAWFGTVLTGSLLRYPLAADGASLALEGPLADGIDDNTGKGDLGESAPYVVGTGFGVITDIEQGPNGSLYVVSLGNGAVYRLDPK
ncbi:MAG: PQQ-dependent sugar dehydrogenase [Actinomycetota bacterium]|nr:PQQ-dependent sugar dehydrogenase [Actinomycetota bacterium]